MEFEDPEEEQEEEELCMGRGTGYDPTRMKIPVAAEPVRSSSSNGVAAGARARYRECLKNHAVGIGGHALDGCGEFMAAGMEGTLDALKCAACSCHRNFHRKETESSALVAVTGDPYLLQHHHPPPPQFAAYYRHPSGYLHVGPGQHRSAAAGGTLALPSTSGGGGTQSTREDQEDVSNNPSAGSKKRFRTKFTQEQKDKMLELAEKLGWRIQKHDEAVVQAFCNETGVKRHVLKVWMHNNKHTLGKKP